MKTVAVYNIKGGVGKTATAVNLSYLCAREGHRTLIWDLDPQAASTFYFRVRPKRKGGARRLILGRRTLDDAIRGTDFVDLDLVRGHFALRNIDLHLADTKRPLQRLSRLLSSFAGEYDFVFLDCPPGISLVSESIFVAADALLVPTIPTTLSVRTLEQLLGHLSSAPREQQSAVLPFLSMVDRRKTLHRQICQELAQSSYGLLSAFIPYSSVVEQMGVHQAPLPVYAASSPVAQAYESLWDELALRINSG